MRIEPKPIEILPDSELARLLDHVGKTPLLLEKGGIRYKLMKEESESEYDADKVKHAILKTAGSWQDIDVTAMLAALYHAREEGSRPLTRP